MLPFKAFVSLSTHIIQEHDTRMGLFSKRLVYTQLIKNFLIALRTIQNMKLLVDLLSALVLVIWSL